MKYNFNKKKSILISILVCKEIIYNYLQTGIFGCTMDIVEKV